MFAEDPFLLRPEAALQGRSNKSTVLKNESCTGFAGGKSTKAISLTKKAQVFIYSYILHFVHVVSHRVLLDDHHHHHHYHHHHHHQYQSIFSCANEKAPHNGSNKNHKTHSSKKKKDVLAKLLLTIFPISRRQWSIAPWWTTSICGDNGISQISPAWSAASVFFGHRVFLSSRNSL